MVKPKEGLFTTEPHPMPRERQTIKPQIFTTEVTAEGDPSPTNRVKRSGRLNRHGLCAAEQDCLWVHLYKLAYKSETIGNHSEVSTCRNFYHANQLQITALSSVAVLFGPRIPLCGKNLQPFKSLFHSNLTSTKRFLKRISGVSTR